MRTRRRRRPLLVVELVVVACLLVVYDQVSALASVRAGEAVRHGRDVLRLEHVGLERRADHWLAGVHWLQAPAAYYYDFAHVLVTMAVLVTAYVLRPERYRRARNALVGINLVGLLTFFTFPVAPPRLLPGAGFVDIVSASHTFGAYEAASTGVGTHANELASMPSLHAGWALWVALTVFTLTRSRSLRTLAVAHVVLTCVVVVVTGNHYALDVVAGFVTTAVTWTLAGRLRRSEVLEVDRAQPELVEA